MKRLVYSLFLLLCSILIMAGCNTSNPTPVPIMRVTVVVRDAATPVGSAEPSPAPSSTPEPLPVCEGTPPVQLIVNQRGRVSINDPQPLNIRAAPGTTSGIIGTIAVTEVFYVLDGPECADGYQWFLIRHEGREGWIAEGDQNNYFVEPFLSG